MLAGDNPDEDRQALKEQGKEKYWAGEFDSADCRLHQGARGGRAVVTCDLDRVLDAALAEQGPLGRLLTLLETDRVRRFTY